MASTNTNASASFFEFNGIRSSDYGISVTAVDIFTAPARSYEQISVSGRNGDIFKDNGKYPNVPVTYRCNIEAGRWLGFEDKFFDFARLMTASVGYCKLTDSYRPGIIRQAVLSTEIKPSSKGAGWTIGEFDVTFSCKPQIWLKDRSISMKLSPVVKGYINSSGYHVSNDAYRTMNYLEIEESAKINLRLKTPATCTVHVFQYNDGAIWNRNEGTLTESNPVISFTADDGVDTIAIYWATAELAGNQLSIVAGGKLVETVNNDGPVLVNDTSYTVYPEIIIAREYSFKTAISFFWDALEVDISGMSSTAKIVIDSESQTITDGSGTNASNLICIKDGNDFAYDFPTIEPGETVIKTAGYVDDGNSNPKGPITITVTGTARTV